APALRSVCSRVPSRYSTTKRWNACWSPRLAEREEVSTANFGFLAAVAPVAPMAAMIATARVQGRMLRLFMDCLSTKWTCMDDAAGLPHVSHSPSQAGAVPAADGCAARTAGTVFRLARRTAARLAGRSPAKAGTHAHGLFVTAERAADGQRRAVADRTLVAQRQRALPALEAEA